MNSRFFEGKSQRAALDVAVQQPFTERCVESPFSPSASTAIRLRARIFSNTGAGKMVLGIIGGSGDLRDRRACRMRRWQNVDSPWGANLRTRF